MSESFALINGYLDYVFTYGTFWVYLAIFVACFVENIFPPFPGDSFIVAAGGLVAVSRLDPAPAMLAVVGGGMCSVMLLYSFGRLYGREYFIRRNFRYLSAADILKVESRFRKGGALLLVVSRFVVGFRVALAVAAGIGRYSVGKTFFYTLISYLLFAGLLAYLGFKLVTHFDVIEHYFRTYNAIVWPILISAVVVFVARRFLQTRRKGTS